MKKLILGILIFLNLQVFAQQINGNVGEIEVSIIYHTYKRNAKNEITKRIDNKRNRPKYKIYFDANGKHLKEIAFGKHHNTDLRLIDYIKLFEYKYDKVIEILEYESDYQENISLHWKTILEYDKNDKLIKKLQHFIPDSSIVKTSYEYNEALQIKKTFFDSTYSLIETYDSLNRIESYSQIYDNELRWKWDYEYSNFMRIGNFKTYYKDNRNHTKQEIKKYLKDRIVEKEERYTSGGLGIKKKNKIYYSDNGIISKVEFYDSYSSERDYKLVALLNVKYKTKVDLTEESISSINDYIQNENYW
jgi:hypothetical protein